MKYASDAGYEAIVELLGGNAGGEEWPDAVYVEGDDGDDGNAGPSGGLWLRHMDPETGLAYHMNDETGDFVYMIVWVRGRLSFYTRPGLRLGGGGRALKPQSWGTYCG